ncbi:metallophosphoesterase [Porphyromonadaceae bacterium]
MKRYALISITILLFAIAGRSQGIKLTHGPYLQNVSSEEVTIVWMSDKPSVGWVELAPDDGSHFYAVERPRYFDTKNGVKTTSTIHSVKLKELSPNTRYRYRVYSQEVVSHEGHKVRYGDFVATNVYTKKPLVFTTANPQSDQISFVMLNDIHGRNDLLERLISQCSMSATDFVLFNGDMVSVFNEENHIFDGFMDKATELFASEIPMYYIRGNHETRGAFATEFQRYFSPREENLYYVFRQGPVCVVVLDTGEDKPDSDIEYAGITDYDGYRSEQARWLEEVVNSPIYKEAPYKVIIAHIPPIGGWHGNIEIQRKFMPLLRDAKPDMMLCGHLHRLVHEKASSSNPFPIIVNPNNAVLKVAADKSKMSVSIVDENGKMLDQFEIKK